MPGNKKNHRKRIQAEKRRAAAKKQPKRVATIGHRSPSRFGAEMAVMAALGGMLTQGYRRSR